MATTTNYGWTTPDDTALVKDGAAAIRTLGSSVDTTTKALNPSTTLGDIEYRSSTANTNTRLGIGTTGQVLTVSGGVPAWGTAAGASWQTYTPTWTNLTKGNGTEISRYIDQNGLITWWYSLVFGSTSSMGTTPIVTLPVAAKSGTSRVPVPNISMLDSGVQVVYGFMDFADNGTDRGVFYAWNTGVNPLGASGISSSAPFTWDTGDAIRFQVSYEKA